MAISATNLAKLRRGVCKDLHPTFTKTEINAALDSINDWWETVKLSGSGAIETAAPGVFNNALKKKIAAYWFEHKFQEDK